MAVYWGIKVGQMVAEWLCSTKPVGSHGHWGLNCHKVGNNEKDFFYIKNKSKILGLGVDFSFQVT